MKTVIVVLILVFAMTAFADDILDIYFYNHPEYELYDFPNIETWQNSIKSDSLRQMHIFSGNILDEYIDDIFPLTFLQNVQCDIALPTDFCFHKTPVNLDYEILASNLESDSLYLSDHYIVKTDSMTIGFFSLYTPDLAVKKDFSSKVNIDYAVFDIAENYAQSLKKKCDYVILLSSMSKIVDVDLVQDLPIDLVLSFDYQKKASGLLKGSNINYYSVISSNGSVGNIRLSYKNGNIETFFSEVEAEISEEIAEEPSDAENDR